MLKQSIRVMTMIMLAGLVVLSACKKDDDEEETPPVIVLDGIYVYGQAAPYSGYDSKGMLSVARNEVTQEDRASLYEIYIPLKAGQDFSLVKVEGSVYTTYGPGAGWGVVAEPTTDEPKDGIILRGEVSEANKAAFQVSEDGMYHVVIDMELMIAVVAHVHWGIIGAATPEGWGTSTVLDESGYNPNKMSWEINDMELRGGDWKFRYSNGWKIELDTVGTDDVKVNTNFGGATDALVAGGDNFVNDAPGLYTILFEYNLGEGYTATLTKTGDLPLTDWNGVVCDAVGTGVSVDNPDAQPDDPNGWNWGNVLVGDNGGVPVVAGDQYTWMWSGIILEANEGFKVRTLNGQAPPSGGANFDAGYGNLDVANSSAKVIDLGGNLGVDEKGTFTIKLVIDAANDDAKTITITED